MKESLLIPDECVDRWSLHWDPGATAEQLFQDMNVNNDEFVDKNEFIDYIKDWL